MMATTVQLSVIVPVGTRYDDVYATLDAYRTALDRLSIVYELIYVLDGPRPDVLEVLRAEQARGANLEVLQLARRFGEATAIVAGFEVSRGAMILTLPAYFQVDPAEIGSLLAQKGDHHMVVGHRWPRAGGTLESLRRSVFHGLLRVITGQSFRDLGCGVRLFDRAVLEEVSVYGDQHRFLPLLAERNGFRVRELDVRQSERDRFRGRYGLREYVRKGLDILTVFFLIRFTKKPLRFFGMVGTVLLGLGALGLLFVVGGRLFFDQALADRPAMLLSALLVVLGVQISALGLLGELIIFTHARSMKEYRVERIVNPAVPVPNARQAKG
jgi:glycosyltransferase involved in cell wall biosynthesis